MIPRPWRLVDWVDLVLRLVVGGVYVAAGAIKIPDPGKFAEAVANYRIVPHELVNLVAITLPPVEVLAGLLLIAGIWVRPSVGLINGLTVVFILAIGSAVVRGLDIECGCFGTVGGREVGLLAIAQDLLLLGGGVWIWWHHRRSPPVAVPEEVGMPSAREGQSP